MSEEGSPSVEEAVSLGYGYAEKHRDDRPSLVLIARARSAPEVSANVDLAALGADGAAKPVAFWSGFAHGDRKSVG